MVHEDRQDEWCWNMEHYTLNLGKYLLKQVLHFLDLSDSWSLVALFSVHQNYWLPLFERGVAIIRVLVGRYVCMLAAN